MRRVLAVAWLAGLSALGPSASASRAAAQIPGVSALCADRPAAAGTPLVGADAAPGPARSGSREERSPSDLFCIDLVPTARGGDAAGVVELRRAQTPFGTAVTADGHHRSDLVAWVGGLPDPSTLGDFTTYVAWVTPATLDPVVRLGPIGNGETRLGEVAFNRYLVWISAEASGDVRERRGPLVLRGRSPSSRMEAHDLLARAPAAAAKIEHDHGGAWSLPPMYPDVPMAPGMMGIRPRTEPLTLAVAAGSATEPVRPSDVPEVRPGSVVSLPDGGTFDLEAGLVRRSVGGRDVLMLAFNGQHPGPLIEVRRASTIFVNFTNRTPFPTSVHWHGLRLDNRFDGVPGVTQDAVRPGETFRYTLRFPDAGIYWYHPHHREDVQQELGLAGNMLVEPLSDDYYGPANRERVLLLDDLLLDDASTVAFGEASANYMLMGRFGNTFLVNGEPAWTMQARRGEVVRFFLTNASNTRTFNLSLRDGDTDGEPLPLKVVGSDVGRFERETWAESAVLAPAERYVVEVRFPAAGTWALTNRVQGVNHRMGAFREEVARLGTVTVSDAALAEDHGAAFATLRRNEDVIADIDRHRDRFSTPPDRELLLTLEVDSLPPATLQSMLWDWAYFNPVEWTGTMPVMNWATTGREVRWIIRDPATGSENMDIHWRYRVGDVVKIRVRNDRGAFHAMQHPLHIHGQRFLVLEQNGVPTENLVWKDTVLLPAGSTTDLLLEITNPGRWMVHCHIAEHLESGMKFVIDVEGG